MTNIRTLRPSELDLQAYLDNELEPQARLRVIEWLLENPESAQELFQIQLREELLRVSVKLSLLEDPPIQEHVADNSRFDRIEFGRYDRFATGFVTAFVVFGIFALLILLVM